MVEEVNSLLQGKEQEMLKNDMINHGSYAIWLTGSRKNIARCVYEKDGKYFIQWYGRMIEVRRDWSGFATVDEY